MGLLGRLWSFMSQHQDLQAALSAQVAHLYWLMEHKEQIMQAIAKVEQQQEKIEQYQQIIQKEAKDEFKKIKNDLVNSARASSTRVCLFGFTVLTICASVLFFLPLYSYEYVIILCLFMGSFAFSLFMNGGIHILKFILSVNNS